MGKEYSYDQLNEEIQKLMTPDFDSLEITGGEPLLHSDYIHDFLKKYPYKAMLETNATKPIELDNLNDVIDIVSKGISKGTGVKAIKKHFNADKMLGIGDSYNDLPLFKASDYSFTFHSSPDSLKEEVNDVVSSVSEAINKVL